MSGYYAQQNAGKRNVSIDLNVPGARELALLLCDTVDVVVENFRQNGMTSEAKISRVSTSFGLSASISRSTSASWYQ